jgi:hypothetical protein
VAAGVTVYRRTRASRAAAAAAAVLFGGVLLFHLLEAPAEGWGRGLIVSGALLAASLLLVVANFGDRIAVEPEGLRFSNLCRERLGLGGSRLLRWEDVEEVRDLRPPGAPRLLSQGPAFVARTREGRRFVLDSLDGIEEIAALLQERAARISDPRRAARP